MPKISALIAATVLTGSMVAAPALAASRQTPEAQLAKALAGRVAGKPTGCISLTQVRSTRIIDGQAILYEVGRTVYVNRPDTGADRLSDDEILVTRSYGAQLCRIDTVRLIDRASRLPSGFVVLGDFVPYRLPDRG